MKRKSGSERQAVFAEALKGKRIPILTLDNKWYKLLTDEARATVAGIEKQLNALLKRQGKLNTERTVLKGSVSGFRPRSASPRADTG